MREDLDDLSSKPAARSCTSPSAICALLDHLQREVERRRSGRVAGLADLRGSHLLTLARPCGPMPVRGQAGTRRRCGWRWPRRSARPAAATTAAQRAERTHMLCRAAGELATARNMAGVAPKAAWTLASRAWRSAVVLAASIRGHGHGGSPGKRPGLDDPLILGDSLDATSSIRHICCPYVHEHARRHPCARSTLLAAGTLPGARRRCSTVARCAEHSSSRSPVVRSCILRQGEMEVRHPGGDSALPRLKIDTPASCCIRSRCTMCSSTLRWTAPDFTCATLDFDGGARNPIVQSLPPVMVVPLAAITELDDLQAAVRRSRSPALRVTCRPTACSRWR